MTATTVAPARPGPALQTAAGTPLPMPAVPRQYVHKRAQAEVLLCGWHHRGEDSFLAPVQWPRSHSFYTPAHGLHDPMLFAESVRQTMPMVSHVGYGAPMDHRQIWDRFRCTLLPQGLHHDRHPADLDMHLTATGIVRRAGRLGQMTLRATALRNGRRIAIAETRFANQAPPVYRRLRGPRHDATHAMTTATPPPAPITAHHTGRTDPHNIVLSPGPTPHHWQLRIDTTHPVLFDHPVDHVPGMLLLEAARQAAHTTHHPHPSVITSIDAQFTRFVELDTPCWIEAHPTPTTTPSHKTVHITTHQNNTTPFTATITSLLLPH